MAIFANGGFPPAWNTEAPDGPDVGPVVNPQTGEFSIPRGHTLRNEWAEVCASAASRAGDCCGGTLRPRPTVFAKIEDNTDHGDVGHAMFRAALIANSARSRTPPAMINAQSCGMPGGPCRVNLANGNFLMYTQPPTSSDFDPVPILTYNSRSTNSSSFGSNWFFTYNRTVKPASLIGMDLSTGMGSVLNYDNPDANNQYTPPAGAVNALKQNGDGSWTETQPDGFKFQYDSSGDLTRLENAVGNRWTVSHDAGGRVVRIADPVSGLTSFSYDGSNNIRRMQDAAGRISDQLRHPFPPRSAPCGGARRSCRRAARWRH